MGSRERRRADRRKRKERSVERRAELAARREASAARIEAKNRAAREQLAPLAEDERPRVVTAAAAISGALALGTVLAYALGLPLVDDKTTVDALVAVGTRAAVRLTNVGVLSQL